MVCFEAFGQESSIGLSGEQSEQEYCYARMQRTYIGFKTALKNTLKRNYPMQHCFMKKIEHLKVRE